MTMKRFFKRSKKNCPEEVSSVLRQKLESEGQQQTNTGKVLVGAIDFGTSYSGWAFSFLQDFKNDPTKAVVKNWYSGTHLVTEKAPSCVLLEPDGKTLVAFGYEAEDRYRELTKTEKYRDYYYFRRFKMMLYKKLGERIDRSITIEDEMGRSLPAMDVFTIAIKYLVDDMMGNLNQRLSGDILVTDIHWVLTVPAIWTDAAKQFMREVAIQAGIYDSKLEIALEPEAASIYCRHLSGETTVERSGVSVSQFHPGTRYLILDAGGGIIDITIHEVGENGIKEVHSATGGSWGGTTVDKAFESMLLKVFGRQVYDRFRTEYTDDWINLYRDFEIKKRALSHEKTNTVFMKFPMTLFELYTTVSGNEISAAISTFKGEIEVIGDKMQFSNECFKSFFTDSSQKIIAHMQSILKDCDVKAILMVGGYSESQLLQHAVKSAFPDKQVIIPVGASATILKGAVIYGHSSKEITERILKYTYGLEICVPFVNGKHPVRKQISHDGKFQCTGIFDKLAEKNQAVPVGKEQTIRRYNPTATYQSIIPIRIYASDQADPDYFDEGACLVGELPVTISDPDADIRREIVVCLTFSGTEILVEAEDRKAKKSFKMSIDFLG